MCVCVKFVEFRMYAMYKACDKTTVARHLLQGPNAFELNE